MEKIKAAVIGYGNIGRYVIEALQVAPDFEIVGVVRQIQSSKPSAGFGRGSGSYFM